MGFYGEQLKERQAQDLRSVRRNERILANSVSSLKTSSEDDFSGYERENLRQIMLIADYFSLELPSFEERDEAVPELIDRILRPAGIMKRRIRLDGSRFRCPQSASSGTSSAYP